MVEINLSFYHYKLKCQKLKKQKKTLSSINIPIFKKKWNGSNKYMFFTEKINFFDISAYYILKDAIKYKSDDVKRK